MKITQHGSPSMLHETYRAKAGITDASAPQRAHGGGGCEAADKIQLSERARNLHAMDALTGPVPDLEKEKVVRIKLRVENGTYRPDARKIAVGMTKESIQHTLLLRQMQGPLLV